MSVFRKRCASVCVAVFSMAKDVVKSLPLFFSVLLGVGWPIRGTDADPDPPRPEKTKSSDAPAQNGTAADGRIRQ
jgi:hypothetical protein